MNARNKTESFISLRRAAAELGVPIAWLKAEAKAGRVPVLKAGRRNLFDVEAVRAALLKRATPQAREGGIDD